MHKILGVPKHGRLKNSFRTDKASILDTKFNLKGIMSRKWRLNLLKGPFVLMDKLPY